MFGTAKPQDYNKGYSKQSDALKVMIWKAEPNISIRTTS